MNESLNTSRKNGIFFISFLQVIAPIFVILGHCLNHISYTGDSFVWVFLVDLRKWIYAFHMDFFFFISGLLFIFTDSLSQNGYFKFIGKKALRLILPYLFWNLLFMLPKLWLGDSFGDPLPEWPNILMDFFIYPESLSLQHLWFLYGLFLIFIISPLFKWTLEKARRVWAVPLMVAVLVALYFIPQFSTIEVCSFRHLHTGLLFFFAGALLASLGEEKIQNLARKPFVWIPFFVTALAMSAVFLLVNSDSYCRFALEVSLIPSFVCIGCLLKKARWIVSVGKASFTIYLFHWPILICCVFFFVQKLGLNIFLAIPINILLAYSLPLAFNLLMNKIPWGRFKMFFYYLLGI
jgi:exopolysaccharide production protein ExoZ